MTNTKKINPVELAICVILTLVIFVTGFIGISHKRKIWLFAENRIPVGLPTETALRGAANTIEHGLTFASAPEGVREKIQSCPEALEWAAEYVYHWDKEYDHSIAADAEQHQFPLLLQWDKRWGYHIYGNNYMGINGCGPTALSIVYTGLTGKTDVSPYDVAVYSSERDMYVPGVGTKWIMMLYGGMDYGLKVEELVTDFEKAKEALQAGEVLVCKVGPGDFTSGGHFIVLTEMDEDGQVTVRDPNSVINSLQKWDFDRIMEQTDFVWSYTT